MLYSRDDDRIFALSFKIDETDAGILKALMQDGRRSLREIARIVSVSTPTVESRLKRLFDMGVIKKISPVIDPEKIEQGIYVLINLKVDAAKIDDVSQQLAEMEEVRCVFQVTGDSNLTIRVVTDSMKSLQEFLTAKISALPNSQLISSNVILCCRQFADACVRRKPSVRRLAPSENH